MSSRVQNHGRPEERLRLIVQGRVQGVWFRASAREQAQGLGLTGWVRNREDGSVEVVAEGPPERLERLTAWCREGPPLARVIDVEEERFGASGEFTSFEVR